MERTRVWSCDTTRRNPSHWHATRPTFIKPVVPVPLVFNEIRNWNFVYYYFSKSLTKKLKDPTSETVPNVTPETVPIGHQKQFQVRHQKQFQMRHQRQFQMWHQKQFQWRHQKMTPDDKRYSRLDWKLEIQRG